MTAPSGRWGDLKARLISGLAMLLAGAVAIWLGGTVFSALAVVVTGLLVQELAAMTAQGRLPRAWGLGVFAGAVLAWVLWMHSPFALAALVLPSVLGLWRIGRDRIVWAVYAFAMMLTGYGLVAIRDGLNPPAGMFALLWIIAVVVASDVMGYFAGRMIGGPKFWPRISPKKTWSGTVAGWIGAVLTGALFVVLAGAETRILWLSPLLAFAGQMGDVAESWIKRRAGVKDSSNLIPGHGGVMDRFDALIGAVVMVLLISQAGLLPRFGG
ncbi:phosphatidate cytidylyltransferase [Paenirhodobacter sp.]|uniref:phosphatidate cytidylyltransferase n=1 Tax=Paenirhodobacter sp. TaxID=1965326 RepID=UPI003B41D0B1